MGHLCESLLSATPFGSESHIKGLGAVWVPSNPKSTFISVLEACNMLWHFKLEFGFKLLQSVQQKQLCTTQTDSCLQC